VRRAQGIHINVNISRTVVFFCATLNIDREVCVHRAQGIHINVAISRTTLKSNTKASTNNGNKNTL
jgi:hypothetical protein